jgi:hypothetical protein
LIGSPVAFSPVPIPHSPGFWMLLAPPLDAAVVGVPLAAVVGAAAAVVGAAAAVVGAAAAVVGAAAAVVGAAAAVVGVPPAAVVAPPLSSSSPHAAIKSTLIAASPRSERFMSLSPLQVSPYVSPDVLAAKYTADGRLGKVSRFLRCSDREHAASLFAHGERGSWLVQRDVGH